MRRARSIVPSLLVLVLAGACAAPVRPAALVASQPGWGRRFTAAERLPAVGTVPAATAPAPPIVSTGKLGWGRTR